MRLEWDQQRGNTSWTVVSYYKAKWVRFEQSGRIFFYSDTITLYLSMLLNWLVSIYEKCTDKITPMAWDQASKLQTQSSAPSPLSYLKHVLQSVWHYFTYLVYRKGDWLFLRGGQWPTLSKCCWVLCKISTSQSFTWVLLHHWGESALLKAPHQPPSHWVYVFSLKSSSFLTACNMCTFGCLFL